MEEKFDLHSNSLNALERALNYEVEVFSEHQIGMILENINKCIYHLDMQNRILYRMLKEMKADGEKQTD